VSAGIFSFFDYRSINFAGIFCLGKENVLDLGDSSFKNSKGVF